MPSIFVNPENGAREDLVVYHSQARRVLANHWSANIMASFAGQPEGLL